MKISYHHANPSGGNESVLLRVRSTCSNSPTTILVDAGEQLTLDNQLADGETLDAVCLTHAHLDHYYSLEQCRQTGTQIYASPATAAIMRDVFDVATQSYGVVASAETVTAIEPTDGWTAVATDVDFHPVPAGHVPGAVGYLFRVDSEEGSGSHHLLATGDFTLRSAGGYPGFPHESIRDVDVLFLTAALREDFSEQLSEALSVALQRAHSGSQTLVTTSGLVGVQVTYLLNELISRFGLDLRVSVVGQVAKLYESLEYACDYVTTIPTFESVGDCLERGTITVAGPEVPTDNRSSDRLFEALCDRPNACVVQLISSGREPRQEGQCTVHDFEVVNHPSRETLENVHDAVDPRHTIVVHRHRGAGKEFNDLDSVVWSPTDADEYTLYADGKWQSPPWMETKRQSAGQVTDQSVAALVDDDVLAGLSLPKLSRHQNHDLKDEGVDCDRIAEKLAYADSPTASSTPTSAANEPTGNGAQSTTETTAMATEKSDSTNGTDEIDDAESKDEQSTEQPVKSLVSTVGAEINTIDDRLLANIEAGDISPEDLATALALVKEGAMPRSDTETEQTDSGDDTTDSSETAENGERTTAETDPATDADSTTEAPEADEDDGEAETAVTAADVSGRSGLPPQGETQAEIDERGRGSATQTTAATSANHPDSSEKNDTQADRDGLGEAAPSHSGDAEPKSGTFTVQLEPLAATLVARQINKRDVADPEVDGSAIATDATVAYLAEQLQGTASDAVPPSEELTFSGQLSQLLDHIFQKTENFEDRAELATAALGRGFGDLLGVDSDVHSSQIEVHVPSPIVDALVEKDSYPFNSRGDVISAAVRWHAMQE